VGLQQGLYSFANVAITATVNSFGPAATTGVSIANNFDGILYQICTATSLAVMPYVSQNIGADNPKRAMQAVRKGVLITVALGASFGLLCAAFSTQLSSLMSSDREVIAFSRQKMIIISSTYFICGINDIICAALRGMGKPIAPTVSTLVFLFGLRFAWVYFVFPLLPNLSFLYLCWPVSWILSILCLLVVFFRQKKILSYKKQSSPGLCKATGAAPLLSRPDCVASDPAKIRSPYTLPIVKWLGFFMYDGGNRTRFAFLPTEGQK
jgi:Na+-driven multidrug efflux pump